MPKAGPYFQKGLQHVYPHFAAEHKGMCQNILLGAFCSMTRHASKEGLASSSKTVYLQC